MSAAGKSGGASPPPHTFCYVFRVPRVPWMVLSKNILKLKQMS